jgi:hypothetical protein
VPYVIPYGRAPVPMQEEAARLQSFVEAAAAKASAAAGKTAAGKKAAAPSGAAAAAAAAAAAGATKGGAPALTPGELQCLALVQSVAATRPEKVAAEQQLREAWSKVTPGWQCPAHRCWAPPLSISHPLEAWSNTELAFLRCILRGYASPSRLLFIGRAHGPQLRLSYGEPGLTLTVCNVQVDPNPQGPSKGVNMKMVARVAWCAAVVGLPELAEQCASRAAAAQVRGCTARASMGSTAVPASLSLGSWQQTQHFMHPELVASMALLRYYVWGGNV